MAPGAFPSASFSDSRQHLSNNVRRRAISIADPIHWHGRHHLKHYLLAALPKRNAICKRRPRRKLSSSFSSRTSRLPLKAPPQKSCARAALRFLMSGPPSRSSTPFRRPSTSQSQSSSTRPRSSSTAGLVSEDAPPPGRERLQIRFLAGLQPPARPSSAAGNGPSGTGYVRQRAVSTYSAGGSIRRPFVPENSRLGAGTPSMPRTAFPASPLNTAGRTYHLQVVQHPERSAEFASSSLSRLPLAPPPIVQLTICNSLGSPINPDTELPFLVAHVSLCAEDGTPLDTPSAHGSHRPIYGSLISSAQTLRNLQGSTGAYFVFPDVSVRRRGRYKLRIALMRLQTSGSSGRPEPVTTLASVYTNVFEIVSQSHYIAPELTPLTQYFIRQGARMYAFELFSSNRLNVD